MSNINSKTCFQEAADSAKGVWPTLVATNPNFIGGLLLVFEATQELLVASGMLTENELPNPKAGCKTSTGRCSPDYKRTYRLADGRVRLTIAAHLVRKQDSGFLDFLSRTVGQAVVNIAVGASTLAES